MEQIKSYPATNLNTIANSTSTIAKDEFNDLKLVDQYIPLEDVYVENLYPFDNTNAYAVMNQYQHSESIHSSLETTKAFFEDYKENNNNNMTYYTSYNSNVSNGTFNNQYYNCVDYSGYPIYYEYPGYYNVAIDKAQSVKSQESISSAATTTNFLYNSEKSYGTFLESSSKSASLTGEKPPEPYANIIVKAILSTNNNVMQLKDIYNYMIENYEYFASQKQSTKWKNSVRHNLSRHKYFVKTCEKNAQGHYWSIDQAYLSIFKNGNFDEKAIKKAKLNSKLKNKASKINKKNSQLNCQEKTNVSSISNSFSDYSSSYVAHSSEMSSPTVSCKSFNSNTNNDSAYMSGNEYGNSSFYSMHNSNVDAPQWDRPNMNLHDTLSEIYMEGLNCHKADSNKKIKEDSRY